MVGVSGIDIALSQGACGMHIDANLIEGFKIGVGVGFVIGLLISFAIAAPIIYQVRKKVDQIRRDH